MENHSILHKPKEWKTIHEAGNPLPLATSITNTGKGWTMNMNKWFMVHPFPMSVILVARGRGFPASCMVFHSSRLCWMDMGMIWRRGSVNSNLHTTTTPPKNKNNWQLKSQYSPLLLMQNGHEHVLKERQCNLHIPPPQNKNNWQLKSQYISITL